MAILVVPLIAMVFPAKQSVGALLPMLIAGDTLQFFAYMLPFVILGTFFGRRLLKVLSQNIFNNLVLFFTGLSSLMLLVL